MLQTLQADLYVCQPQAHERSPIPCSALQSLPLLDIEVRMSKTGTVINNGEVIQILHGEETDVECAVVGSVSPPVELRWVTSEDHIQTYVSTTMHHGPSSSVQLNGSHVTHEGNITCRAVQWMAGRPYLTIESSFTLKRSNSPQASSSNVHAHTTTIAATIPSLVTILAIVGLIVFIIWRKKSHSESRDITFHDPGMIFC
eukprot:XP_011670389.1 PREDICTED: uncharacterized protein LOC105441191 [Strongylocentrotus purpuratus]